MSSIINRMSCYTITVNKYKCIQQFQQLLATSASVMLYCHSSLLHYLNLNYSSMNIQISALCGQTQITIVYSGLFESCDNIAYQTADGQVMSFCMQTCEQRRSSCDGCAGCVEITVRDAGTVSSGRPTAFTVSWHFSIHMLKCSPAKTAVAV